MPGPLRAVMLVLDGIAAADQATRTALDLCRRTGAFLELVAIYDAARVERRQPGRIGSSAAAGASEQQIGARLKERLEGELSACADAARAAGLRHEERLVACAGLATILEQLPRADLIVVPNTLRQRRSEDSIELELGLDTTELVQHTPRPVLLVPDRGLDEGRVLIGYDGRPPSARAVAAAVHAGLLTGRPVHILTIAEDQATARRTGEAAAVFLSRHDIAATLEPIAGDGSPAELLTGLAERLQPALFVMGAQEPQGLVPWLFGGNTERLVDRLPSPVLACA